MSNTIISANMSLPIPVPGVDPGQDWAFNINSCLGTLDQHNHANGSGVQITPAGLNLSSDLTFLGNNAINLRTVRFSPQTSQPSLGTDLGCLYEYGTDLYYNDGSGNKIRITQSGSIVGATGSITGLVSPASASYISGSQTFVFQAGVNLPASLDGADIILRNHVANSKGLTLSPPTAMAADYSIIMPALPSQQSFVTLDNAGNMSAPWTVDNNTIKIVSNQLVVQPANIMSVIPSGTITAYGGATAPSGYLLCDGTSYLNSAYPNLYAVILGNYGTADSTHFNVPDLRGQFLRGVSGSSGNDPDAASRIAGITGGATGNNVGSAQGYAIQSHIHLIEAGHVSGGGSQSYSTGLYQSSNYTGSTGGNETRPINVYVNYIIKT